MIYLLQDDFTPSNYVLMERTSDGIEVFYHGGHWTQKIPVTFEDSNPEVLEYKNGKPINWWTTAYSDSVDAKVIVRRKTREGYLKWVSEHPELFI